MIKDEFFKKEFDCTVNDYDWYHYSHYLCMYHSDNFNKWWYPDLFNWNDCFYLCIYCYNDFDQWWDPDKFKYTWTDYLYYYCIDYKDIWYPYYILNEI